MGAAGSPGTVSGTEFDKLLGALGADRETAGQQYERIRRKLVRYFESHGCSFPDEQADEVIDRVAAKISDGLVIQAADPATYFYGVARYLLKEYWDQRSRAAFGLQETPEPVAADKTDEAIERQTIANKKERELECLDGCLKMLPADRRELITTYYQGQGGDKIANRKAMAARLGTPISALRSKALRVRETLEKCLEDCLAA
ncbi:MAG TPA: hypothetical protein VI756_24105 [Blastocatellia bacterium]